MTPNQYRAVLAKLDLSQRSAAKFLGINERTSRRWAENGPPEIVAKLLRLMVRLGLRVEDVM